MSRCKYLFFCNKALDEMKIKKDDEKENRLSTLRSKKMKIFEDRAKLALSAADLIEDFNMLLYSGFYEFPKELEQRIKKGFEDDMLARAYNYDFRDELRVLLEPKND